MKLSILGSTVFALCITLSVMFTPTAAIREIQELKSSNVMIETHNSFAYSLPRKSGFGLSEKATTTNQATKATGVHTSTLQNKQNEAISGTRDVKEEIVEQGRTSNIGTSRWNEHWTSEIDTTQYFTMDYSHVRRRRPIHNKSMPVSP